VLIVNSGMSNSAHSLNSTYPRSPFEYTYKGNCYESIAKSFIVTGAFQLLVPAGAWSYPQTSPSSRVLG
jgi:hypothetical protein